MAAIFKYHKRVEFSETDMAGIAHFANFFRWMEAAETELFDHLGVPLIETEGNVVIGWPRTRVFCDFHAPLHYRDEVEVQVEVVEIKIRSVEYRFRFYKLGGSEPLHVATAGMTTVFAKRDDDGMRSFDIPVDLLKALKELIN